MRNARTGFRQIEMPHIMENILYNELIIRGFKIDVGVVYENIKTEKGNYRKVAREIDFIIQKGMKNIIFNPLMQWKMKKKYILNHVH